MNVTAIATLITSIILFVAFMLFSFANYKKKFCADYDIRNHFPYELNYDLKFVENFYGNLTLVLSLLAGIFFFIFFNDNHSDGLLTFALVAGIIVLLDIGFIVFVPLKYLRTHMVLDVFLFTFTFMLPCSGAVSGFLNFSNTNKISQLVIAILFLVVVFILFVIIMNPKLSKWAQMKSVANDDGTVTYVRPKYFVLAFSEWLLIMSLFVSMILLFLLVTIK